HFNTGERGNEHTLFFHPLDLIGERGVRVTCWNGMPWRIWVEAAVELGGPNVEWLGISRQFRELPRSPSRGLARRHRGPSVQRRGGAAFKWKVRPRRISESAWRGGILR